MFNIKNEMKAVFVKWASRSHLDVIEEKWYSNELLAKKKKKDFSRKKSATQKEICGPPQMLAKEAPSLPHKE